MRSRQETPRGKEKTEAHEEEDWRSVRVQKREATVKAHVSKGEKEEWGEETGTPRRRENRL